MRAADVHSYDPDNSDAHVALLLTAGFLGAHAGDLLATTLGALGAAVPPVTAVAMAVSWGIGGAVAMALWITWNTIR